MAADRIAAGLAEVAQEKLDRAAVLRGEASGLVAEARALLDTIEQCPACGRTGAPWCRDATCGCSESCPHLWHEIKGHRR